MVNEDLQFVIDCLPTAERLAQLAEECVEAAHAAMKLRRCYDRTNPSRTPKEVAIKNLQEEIADILLTMKTLGLDTEEHWKIYEEISADKTVRWAKTLEAAR